MKKSFWVPEWPRQRQAKGQRSEARSSWWQGVSSGGEALLGQAGGLWGRTDPWVLCSQVACRPARCGECHDSAMPWGSPLCCRRGGAGGDGNRPLVAINATKCLGITAVRLHVHKCPLSCDGRCGCPPLSVALAGPPQVPSPARSGCPAAVTGIHSA